MNRFPCILSVGCQRFLNLIGGQESHHRLGIRTNRSVLFIQINYKCFNVSFFCCFLAVKSTVTVIIFTISANAGKLEELSPHYFKHQLL